VRTAHALALHWPCTAPSHALTPIARARPTADRHAACTSGAQCPLGSCDSCPKLSPLPLPRTSCKVGPVLETSETLAHPFSSSTSKSESRPPTSSSESANATSACRLETRRITSRSSHWHTAPASAPYKSGPGLDRALALVVPLSPSPSIYTTQF
jgi:hypothetical protein